MTALRVLLAEDEALVALALADCLEAEGHEVAVARDGAEALNMSRGLDGLDLLVTDLCMPHLGSEGVIRALRAERPGLPVVVVTGSAPFGDVDELRRRGGGDGPLLLRLKPADQGELAAAVRRVTTARRDADSTAAPAAAPRMEFAS